MKPDGQFHQNALYSKSTNIHVRRDAGIVNWSYASSGVNS